MFDRYNKWVAERLLNSLFVGVCHDSSVTGAEIAVADRKIGESVSFSEESVSKLIGTLSF